MEIIAEELLEWAKKVAVRGGQHTLKYFKKDIEIELKKDQTPVTLADKEAEWIVREMITEQFPEHGILGEEFGNEKSDSTIQWIIDPIDGTFSFIHGVPLYTTLIGVVVEH